MPAGFAAIGVAVAGAFGAGAIGTIGAIAVGVISSAVVGAAIGGITAAITGGDIGKGLLFGAVGGVITGGLAGGAIGSGITSITGSTAASITSGSMAPVINTAAGYGAGLTMPTAVSAAAKTGGLFAGGIGSVGGMGTNTIMGQIATKAIDLAASGFGEEAHVDWRTTEEGVRYAGQNALDRQRIASSSSGGGGGGGGAQMPWQNTEEGAKYTLAEQWKQAQLREDSASARLKDEYSLQSAENKRSYEQQTAKFGEAADVAGGQEFEGATDEARNAIREKQATGEANAAQALAGFDVSEPVTMQA